MNPKQKLIEDIRIHEEDIRQHSGALKELKEDLKELVDSIPEAIAVGRLKDQLAMAKEDMTNALKRNGEINDLMEDIAAQTEVVKSTKDQLSTLLVAYFGMTNEKQVQMDEQGHARDVILSAKLGKDEKSYQESIFNTEVLNGN